MAGRLDPAPPNIWRIPWNVYPAQMDSDQFMQWLEDASADELEEFGSGGALSFSNPELRRMTHEADQDRR